MEIKINKKGKIITGDHAGWFVKIVDDRDGKTGGIYIYKSEKLDGSGTLYNDWLEKIEDLEGYTLDCNWEIEWLED